MYLGLIWDRACSCVKCPNTIGPLLHGNCQAVKIGACCGWQATPKPYSVDPVVVLWRGISAQNPSTNSCAMGYLSPPDCLLTKQSTVDCKSAGHRWIEVQPVQQGLGEFWSIYGHSHSNFCRMGLLQNFHYISGCSTDHCILTAEESRCQDTMECIY